MTESSNGRVLGPVVVRLPPEPSLSKVLRLAASAMGALGGYSVEEIEDVKIAVSEVMIALVEHGSGNEVEISLSIDTDFIVRGSTESADFDADHPDLLLCRTVLEGVSAAHGIAVKDNEAQIWATVHHTVTD